MVPVESELKRSSGWAGCPHTRGCVGMVGGVWKEEGGVEGGKLTFWSEEVVL